MAHPKKTGFPFHLAGSFLLALAVGPLPAAQIARQPNPLALVWLSVPDATRTWMRSGFDYDDGNYDSGNLVRVEPDGLSFSNRASAWVLFEAREPGMLTSIWFTGKSKQGQAYLGGRLNFFFDGEQRPRLSGRLPELLESGKVFPKGLAERTSGGWISYAPLRFRSLKITLDQHEDAFTHRQNGRGERIPHLYHQFTWQKVADPGSTTTPASLAQTVGFAVASNLPMPGRAVTVPVQGTAEVVRLAGPGILNQVQFDFGQILADDFRVRVVADGQERVALKISELFGFSRQARAKARFASLLMGVEAGRYTCGWPMPYRDKLVLTLENPGPACQVAVAENHQDGWPQPEHFYFHAARMEDQTVPGRDIRLLAAQGRGHFVGCILELASKTLEGDDRFYVDGEAFPPAWHGTGTEDYFRCGWYFHGGPLTRPLYGLLDDDAPKIAYRFHLADRINYTNSVLIGFEHGHKNEYLGPYHGTVFWYAER